jgi:hypothetical protein
MCRFCKNFHTGNDFNPVEMDIKCGIFGSASLDVYITRASDNNIALLNMELSPLKTIKSSIKSFEINYCPVCGEHLSNANTVFEKYEDGTCGYCNDPLKMMRNPYFSMGIDCGDITYETRASLSFLTSSINDTGVRMVMSFISDSKKFSKSIDVSYCPICGNKFNG